MRDHFDDWDYLIWDYLRVEIAGLSHQYLIAIPEQWTMLKFWKSNESSSLILNN